MACIMGKTEETWRIVVASLSGGGGGMVERERGIDLLEPLEKVSTDIVSTLERIDDRFIVPRPFGV